MAKWNVTLPSATLVLEYNIKMACVNCLQDKSIFEEQFYTWPPSYNDTVSIHIPLHRTLSAILQKIVLLPWSDHDRGFLSVLLPLDCYERDKLTKDEVTLLFPLIF